MVNKIKELADTALKMGGVAFDTAESAGLFSACQYLKLHLTEKEFEEGLLPESAHVVTEVYIYFEDDQEMDRVFLYSDSPKEDIKTLKEAGCITDNKLIIEEEEVHVLADKGYCCLYSRAEDGHNGKAFVRYNNIFGDNRKMVSFQMWNDDSVFEGNGVNQAIFMTTKFERVFVMPDIYQVEESIRLMREQEKENGTDTPDLEKYDLPGLEKIVQNDIEQFMMESGIRELGIDFVRESDLEAWDTIRNAYPVYKEQLIKTGVAKIVFDNGWLQVIEDYPASRFEKCVQMVSEKNNTANEEDMA